jgi:hypothetical protein
LTFLDILHPLLLSHFGSTLTMILWQILVFDEGSFSLSYQMGKR